MELCIHYRPVAEEASGWSRGSTWPTAVSTWDRSLRSPGRGVGAVWSEGWACCKAKSTLHLAGSAVVPCTIHSHFSSQSLCHLPSLSISDINGVQPSVNEPLEVARTSQNVLNLLGKKKKKMSSPWRCNPQTGSHKDKSRRTHSHLHRGVLCLSEI